MLIHSIFAYLAVSTSSYESFGRKRPSFLRKYIRERNHRSQGLEVSHLKAINEIYPGPLSLTGTALLASEGVACFLDKPQRFFLTSLHSPFHPLPHGEEGRAGMHCGKPRKRSQKGIPALWRSFVWLSILRSRLLRRMERTGATNASNRIGES